MSVLAPTGVPYSLIKYSHFANRIRGVNRWCKQDRSCIFHSLMKRKVKDLMPKFMESETKRALEERFKLE